MKTKIALFSMLAMAAAMVSCSGNKAADNKETVEEEKVEAVKLEDTKWKLAEYTVADSTVKVNCDNEYYLTFNAPDSTFNMTTDCNSIGGKFVVAEDSLKFENTFSTRMTCPTMDVEMAMNAILPTVATYSIEDSVLTLKAADKAVATFKVACDAANCDKAECNAECKAKAEAE